VSETFYYRGGRFFTGDDVPRFLVKFIYDKDPLAVAATRELELPLNEKEFQRMRLNLESAVFVEAGEGDFVHAGVITALDDILEKNVRAGDVVYRDWDDLDPSGHEAYKQLVDSYKPLWGGGPGSQYIPEWLRIWGNARTNKRRP